MNKIEKKALKLWGNSLHKDYPAPAHAPQLREIFQDRWNESLRGSFLEIGCGAGSDIEFFSKIPSIQKINAIDLGSTVKELSLKYKHRDDITIANGNALSLKFANNSFDLIYSFGVFHHTGDPIKCISEAKRVLKQNGRIFLYLYSAHEDIFLKRVGILFENFFMKLFKFIPYFFQNIICILLAPICWIFFSIPAKVIRFLGYEKFAKKIPYYWGTHPFSIVGDVKDRLMSPINTRFKKIEMEKILKDQKFSDYEVVKTASGLYIFALK